MTAIYRFCIGHDFTADLNQARSPLLEELEGRFPRSSSGLWSLPAKLGDVAFSSGVFLTHTKEWPDVQYCFDSFTWLLSERCASLFQELAAEDVELFPVPVATSVKLRPAPPYFLMNVHRVVACFSLTTSEAELPPRGADLDVLCSLAVEEDFIDPSRIPPTVACWTSRYFGGTFVTGPLAKALLATRPKYADLIPVRLKRETPAQRTAALARIRRESAEARQKEPPPAPTGEVAVVAVRKTALASIRRRYDEAMKKKPPRAPKVAISQTAVPEVVAAFFASDARRDFRNVEVFDADGCSSAMGSLLAWKDLRWPKSHIPIADDGRGGYFALDTTRTKAGDCPVVYFDHELADVDKKSGAITPNFEPCDDTFAAWLKRVKNGSTGLPRRKR